MQGPAQLPLTLGIESFPGVSMHASAEGGRVTFALAVEALPGIMEGTHTSKIWGVVVDSGAVTGVVSRPFEPPSVDVHMSSPANLDGKDEAFAAVQALGLLERSREAHGLALSDAAVTMAQVAVRHDPALAGLTRNLVVVAAQALLLDGGLADVVRAIGPARMAIQEAVTSDVFTNTGHVRLGMDTRSAERIHAAMLAYPALAGTLASLTYREPPAPEPHAVAMGMLTLVGLAPATAREFLRQMSLGGGPATYHHSLGRTLGRIPRDWLPGPGDADGWAVLARLSHVLEMASSATSTPVSDLVAPARGRWGDFAERLAAVAGVELGIGHSFTGGETYGALLDAARDVLDMATDAAETLVIPLAAFSGAPLSRDPATRAAGRLLFAGKGLPRVLEMSRRWHVAGGVPLDSQGGGASTMAWDPALPAWRGPLASVIPLRSRAMLRDEGMRGPDVSGLPGLSHCVATRWRECMRGRARVMGIRDTDGTRLSTFEVRFRPGGPSVIEHKGAGNSEPPAAAVSTMLDYMARIGDGRLAHARPATAVGPSGADSCGYDWRDPGALGKAVAAWSPHLPRWARDSGPLELGTRLSGMGAR